MAARMYLFGGAAAEPKDSSWVITWTEVDHSTLGHIRVIHSKQQFPTYPQAASLLAGLKGVSAAVVSFDPAKTCVPLAALADYRLAHNAPPRRGTARNLPGLRIFEYAPQR